MTASELIEELKQVPRHAPIVVRIRKTDLDGDLYWERQEIDGVKWEGRDVLLERAGH